MLLSGILCQNHWRCYLHAKMNLRMLKIRHLKRFSIFQSQHRVLLVVGLKYSWKIAGNALVKCVAKTSTAIDWLSKINVPFRMRAEKSTTMFTHCNREKISALLQTTFWNSFFLYENCCIVILMPLKFLLKGPVHNKQPLVQITAWRRIGNKPLSANDCIVHWHMYASVSPSKLNSYGPDPK